MQVETREPGLTRTRTCKELREECWMCLSQEVRGEEIKMWVPSDTTRHFNIKSTLQRPHFLNLRFTGVPLYLGFTRISWHQFNILFFKFQLNSFCHPFYSDFYYPTSSFKVIWNFQTMWYWDFFFFIKALGQGTPYICCGKKWYRPSMPWPQWWQ